MSSDPYNAETRRFFANPVHAGDAGTDYAFTAIASVEESADGARLRLSAGLQDGRIGELRFRAFGCPHLVAAAEWACAAYEGKAAADLADFEMARCMTILGVPVEKTGRILLLEDALKTLGEQLRESKTT